MSQLEEDFVLEMLQLSALSPLTTCTHVIKSFYRVKNPTVFLVLLMN